jgi:hypothetical protein
MKQPPKEQNGLSGLICTPARGLNWRKGALASILGALLFVAVPGLTIAQPPAGITALNLLNQMSTASGWSPKNNPDDVLAYGTLTQYDGKKSTTTDFVIKQKGQDLSRIEIQGGDLVTLTHVDQASYVRRNGTQVLPFAAAISMRPYAFPFYSDLTAFSDAKVTLTYVGPQVLGAKLAHQIDLVRAPAADDPQANARTNVDHLSVWISDATHLPSQIKFTRVSPDDPTALVDHLLAFSDYRTVGGVLIPFHQEEYVGAQRIAVLQLNDVQTNVGLADANFVFLGLQK